MATRLQWDMENNAETWADAAREQIERFPPETHALIMGASRVFVEASVADAFMKIAEALPGWADGPEYARSAILRYDGE